MCGITRSGKVWGARRGTFKCSCFWISWGNWILHRRVPRRLGTFVWFCILNLGYSFSHATHLWVFFGMSLVCPCKNFFTWILFFQKKIRDLFWFTWFYMVDKCKSFTFTLIQFYTIQNQFTWFYTYTYMVCISKTIYIPNISIYLLAFCKIWCHVTFKDVI